ncbi:hypothetical protein EDD16DRAFT_1652120 [Pisolithus croceorrhizus]|nr:hypothetical protein EDD16DRAFT_1652120 [Pisolithus croceorrhizus]KAI6102530.1 hypothetical protein EV401DRAFT_2023749 [Pisolithus croceorrhizus]
MELRHSHKCYHRSTVYRREPVIRRTFPLLAHVRTSLPLLPGSQRSVLRRRNMWISRVVVVPVLPLFPHYRFSSCGGVSQSTVVHTGYVPECEGCTTLLCMLHGRSRVRRTDNGEWNCNSQSSLFVPAVRVYACRSPSLQGSSTPLSDVSHPESGSSRSSPVRLQA